MISADWTQQAVKGSRMKRLILLVIGLPLLLTGPLSAQTPPASEDRRAMLQRDLKHRQTLLSQQEAKVREAENNVMQARLAYDQTVSKQATTAAAGKQTGPGSGAPSQTGLKPAGAGGSDPGSIAYKALDSATYKLNVLRADERNLRESVKVLREALAR